MEMYQTFVHHLELSQIQPFGIIFPIAKKKTRPIRTILDQTIGGRKTCVDPKTIGFPIQNDISKLSVIPLYWS
jgi:hypothetical protein